MVSLKQIAAYIQTTFPFPDFEQVIDKICFSRTVLCNFISFNMPSNNYTHSIVSCAVELSPRKLLFVLSL